MKKINIFFISEVRNDFRAFIRFIHRKDAGKHKQLPVLSWERCCAVGSNAFIITSVTDHPPGLH